MPRCLFACFCLVHLSDQACIYFCLHSWVSLFLPLRAFDTLCPFYLYLCVFPSVCLPDYRCSRVFTVDVSGFVFLMTCVCVSAYTPVCISFLHLVFCLWVRPVSCLRAPIYVGIPKCACLGVSTFLFMSLCWACLWETRQTRDAPMIYTLSDPVCQWKDSSKWSSPLMTSNRITANISHGETLICIFLTFPNAFCWHSSFTLRIYLPWSKCLYVKMRIKSPFVGLARKLQT